MPTQYDQNFAVKLALQQNCKYIKYLMHLFFPSFELCITDGKQIKPSRRK